MTNLNLNVKSFKKMEDPISKETGKVKYVFYAQAKTVPVELSNWMGINPREQKMTTNVATKIKNSLENNSNFHELSRGIVMSVDSIKYDNKTGECILSLEDSELHGNIDGGHTLRAILDLKNKIEEDRYVYFEVFTGVNSTAEIAELAAARNTSVQVDLKSIAELEKSFDVLKVAFSNLSFSNRISYKMNEHYNDSSITSIDIREVISILIMFSQEIYPYNTVDGTLSEIQPVQCCTGKEASLKRFLNLDKNKREKMINDMQPIINDIFDLWDKIECEFANVANSTGKRYGSRKYSRYNNGNIVDNALFSETELEYCIPNGIIYPLVGAFRALVKVDKKNKKYSWSKSPFETWDILGKKLATILLDEKADGPDTLGKNTNLWSNLFKEVYIYDFMSK